MMLPGPMSAPSMWLNARISNVAGDGDAWTEEHVRLDGDVGGEPCVGGQEDRGRIDHRHAGLHRGFAQPALQHSLGAGQFGAGVDAGQFVRRRLDR